MILDKRLVLNSFKIILTCIPVCERDTFKPNISICKLVMYRLTHGFSGGTANTRSGQLVPPEGPQGVLTDR